MTIHDEIRLTRYYQESAWTTRCHEDCDAEAAELAIYETARALGYLTTQAARIASLYGHSLNL